MHWEVEMLDQALRDGDVLLARRYLSKLHEQLWCCKCKGEIRWSPEEAVSYFKGFNHTECNTKETP